MGRKDCREAEETEKFLQNDSKKERKMKKRIISLVTALVLCVALATMCFTASAVTPITGTLNGRTCTGSVAYFSTYGKAVSSLSGASYLYVKCGFKYGYGTQARYGYKTQEDSGLSSLTVLVSPSGYPVGLGAMGTHKFYYGDGYAWAPNQHSSVGDISGIDMTAIDNF